MRPKRPVPHAAPRFDLCVVAPPESAPQQAQLTVWHTAPGLCTGITSSAGDNLEISVCAEMYQSGGSLWFRALVDGEVANPSDVMFKSGNVQFDGARSFTFIKENVGEGQHLIEIQWRTGTAAQIRDRVLTVSSGSASAGPVRIATACPPSAAPISRSSSTYADIPGLSTTIITSEPGTMAITFSAEAWAASGKMMVRPVVNGAPSTEITFIQAGDPARDGTRSFTFGFPLVKAGTHDIKLQWKASSGSCQLGDRSLCVSAAPISAQRAATFTASTAIIVDNSGWKSLGVTDFSSIHPVATLAVTFSGEVVSNRGRLFVRVLVDGEPASPHDVTLIQGGSKWRAASYTFIVKNLRAATRHRIKIEGLADPNTKVQVKNRSLRALWARRSGSDFVQPFLGSSPRFRRYKLLVIGLDPMRPTHPAPTFDQVKAVFQGDPQIVIGGTIQPPSPFGLAGGVNLSGWLRENSGGRVTFSEIRYYGCGNPTWYTPPLEHQGTYYWDNGAFPEMWRDTVEAADPDVDFHAYDANGNNTLEIDEVVVALIRPQRYPYGTLRGTTAVLDSATTPLSMPALDLYLSDSSAQRTPGVGVSAHELSHLIFGTMDLYGSCGAVSAGQYNIMDDPYNATHLDPFYKMKNGCVHPQAIELTTQPTAVFKIRAVEQHHEILLLHDIEHVAREYFIIENRFGGTSQHPNYDTPLGPGALLVWQLFEDVTLVQTSAVCPGDVRIVRLRAVLNTAGESFDLAWADGTPVGFRVTATLPVSATAEVRLEKL